MLIKIAWQNLKKSLKDYSIYFLTLLVAVAIFYIFNSLEAQNVLLELSSSKAVYANLAVEIISYVSVFVSFVLGFLIVYSNNFLIKKRKKELGTYLVLGMSKRKVSFILFIETFLIGILSLIFGLLLGVFLSQFISVFTAKLFEVNMRNYHFVFSVTTIIKTISYFGLMFICVILFNTITLSKYKLIDLLNANKKNENIKIRNKYLCFISFALAMIIIGRAYYLLYNGAIEILSNKTIYMFVEGAIGTFLFFYSLAGFLLSIVQKLKKIYYRNLNMFVLKQVNNKINTNVLTTTVISLLLLLTICILAGSMSLSSAFNSKLVENNLTDYTIKVSAECEYDDCNLEDFLKKQADLSPLGNYTYISLYDSSLELKDMMSNSKVNEEDYNPHILLYLISYTDYKRLMSVYNMPISMINENEYLLIANHLYTLENIKPFYENNGRINIGGVALYPGSKHIISLNVENSNVSDNYGVLVVNNDDVIKDLTLINYNIVGNYYVSDKEQGDNDLIDLVGKMQKMGIYDYVVVNTKEVIASDSIGLKVLLIYIGLYLGFVFAISSATILAITQLSEAADNSIRYRILKKLGCDNKMIKRALFKTIAISFLLPLSVAVIHSVVALYKLNTIFKEFGELYSAATIILTTGFIIVIYGGYFLLTYTCSTNVIKD